MPQIYSRKQLINRGLLKVKSVAHDLGVMPTGDKRLIHSWVDAIVEHQATQKIETVEAVIDFDGDRYVVIVGGKVVHRTATYPQAERHCNWHGYTLDNQTLVEIELEQATARAEKAKSVEVLEQTEDEGFVKFVVQSGENIYTVTPAHPNPKERCECGDSHFRGVECKHQLAVKGNKTNQISFISPTGFGYYEAIVNGDVHHVIATINQNFTTGEWVVTIPNNSFSFGSYQKAEDFIKDKYVEDIFMGRGSGRIEQPIEDMGITIEDSNFVHDFGQSYTVRIHNILAGYIWLNSDHGWTLNGREYQDDWRPVASQLVKLTRHELVA